MNTFDVKEYTRGETIIKEGDIADRAFIINKGQVKIQKLRDDGQFFELATIGPGQVFGEMCLFGLEKRSATVVALSEVQVQVLYKTHFMNILKDTPQEIKLMISLLSNRLQKTSTMASKLSLDLQKSNIDQDFLESFVKDNYQNIIFPT